jgi:hypothetical protein
MGDVQAKSSGYYPLQLSTVTGLRSSGKESQDGLDTE